jgi:hypothetical protein
MTIYLYALENTRAHLCAKQATVSCEETADVIEAMWKAEGFLVNRSVEN